jgi:hypothetical protein
MMAAIVRNLGVDRQFFPVFNEGDRKSIATYLNLGVNCDRKARQRLGPIYRIQRRRSAYSGRKFAPTHKPRCLATYARNVVTVRPGAA